MNHHRQAPFVATCPDCDVSRDAAEPNELVDFYRRHYRHTGHDVAVTRADLDRDLDFDLDATDREVAAVVEALEARNPDWNEDGVPIGIVAAAMSERGFTVGETLEAIYEVRMSGALYEPRDDHLAVF